MYTGKRVLPLAFSHGRAAWSIAMRGNQDSVCGCFPTGRHYPGIADLIARAIQNIEGLCEQWGASDSWSEIPLAVIDFETTGTNPEQDRIIEVGVVCFHRGQLTRREALLINPGMPIPAEATAVHTITDQEVEGAPSFAEALAALAAMLAGHLPVAYNAAFDRGFLLAETERNKHALAGFQGELPPALRTDVVWLDPLIWAREILKDQKSRRLGDVAAHFGIALEQAHRAAGDAEATGWVLLALADHMPRVYGELVRLQTRYGAFQDADRMSWQRR